MPSPLDIGNAGPGHPRHDKAVHQPSDREDDRPGEKGRYDRPGIGTEKCQHPVSRRQIERGVHAQHQEIALGEIDDAHRAEDDVEPDAHQGIGAADQNAGRERLPEIDHQKWHRRSLIGISFGTFSAGRP
jgi:hypothetical protein